MLDWQYITQAGVPVYEICSPVAISGMAACVRMIFDDTPLTAQRMGRGVITSVFVGLNANLLASEYFTQRGIIVTITSSAALCADYVVGFIIKIMKEILSDPVGLLAKLLLKMFPGLAAVEKIVYRKDDKK